MANNESFDIEELLENLSLPSSDDTTDVLDVALDTNGNQVSFAISDVNEKTKSARNIISVPPDFVAKLGAKITDDLVINGFIAGGWQGGIFSLADGQGNQRNDLVLKCLNAGAVMGDLEKEWAIGQSVNVLCKKDGSLPGFMRTAEALRSNDKAFVFKGMLLERLNGKVVQKILSDKMFNDISYVRDMLFQVFTALDTAYTVLGFHHTDLRLLNIMEHYETPHDPSTRQFKIIDYGLAYLEKRNSKLFRKLAKSVFAQVKDPVALRKVFVSAVNPKEYVGKMVGTGYRIFWYQHDDVYHLLSSMTTYLDGRIWPVEDREGVMQFRELLKYVTGTKLKVYFTDKYKLTTSSSEIKEHPDGAAAGPGEDDGSKYEYNPETDNSSDSERESRRNGTHKHVQKPEKGVVRHRGMVQGLRIFANKLRSHLGMFHNTRCTPTAALKFPFFDVCHTQMEQKEYSKKLASTYIEDRPLMSSGGHLNKDADGVIISHDVHLDDEIEVEWDPSTLGESRSASTLAE